MTTINPQTILISDVVNDKYIELLTTDHGTQRVSCQIW